MVEAALYQDGVRVSTPASLADTFRELREQQDGMAWIGLARPTEAEILSLAAEFDLHPLAVEDAMEAHQRPKLERYGDTLFVVLRAARYLDAPEEVDFGELHVFVGPDFLITVRHGAAPDLSAVRRRMEETPELLKLGPEAVLYAILDAVVDGYAPVVAGVQNDIDEIETEVFRGDPEVSRRIYELSREMVEFQRATRPLVGMLHGLMAGFAKYGTDEELQRYLRDVADHVTHTSERVDGFRQALTDILTVNATLVTQQQNAEMRALAEAGFEQNEEIKKISSWAAILFAPTLVGTIYGMNFEHMPELQLELRIPLRDRPDGGGLRQFVRDFQAAGLALTTSCRAQFFCGLCSRIGATIRPPGRHRPGSSSAGEAAGGTAGSWETAAAGAWTRHEATARTTRPARGSLPQPGPAPPAVAGAAHPRRPHRAHRMGRRLPPARLPHPGSRVTDMPELHTRLLADVIALGSPYPLVLTGGYAVRAHHLINRPSQDLDVATENPAPMADIAATLPPAWKQLDVLVRPGRGQEPTRHGVRLCRGRCEAVFGTGESQVADWGVDAPGTGSTSHLCSASPLRGLGTRTVPVSGEAGAITRFLSRRV